MLYVAIHGRVQGVGFRWFVREKARALGLQGWVRNRSDGAVEILAVGDQSALQELQRLVRVGPSGANVSRVESLSEAPTMDAMNPFGILR